ARVAIPRLDAAGRACALWLARAGVGTIILPKEYTPAPSSDSAGLLLATDAGKPLSEVVAARVREHFPDLQLGGEPTHTAAEIGGPEAALTLIRTIVDRSAR